jgi:Na+-translocating ferredoxin:NAD+ oxidoreductase RNF subunit RnfB
MLDDIDAQLQSADKALLNMNRKMHAVLQEAGGGCGVAVNLCLVAVLLSIALYLYQTWRTGHVPS